MQKAKTPSEMGRKSWESRKKKYGEKGAVLILKKASKKAAKNRTRKVKAVK